MSEKGGNRTDPTAAAGPSRHVPGGAWGSLGSEFWVKREEWRAGLQFTELEPLSWDTGFNTMVWVLRNMGCANIRASRSIKKATWTLGVL